MYQILKTRKAVSTVQTNNMLIEALKEQIKIMKYLKIRMLENLFKQWILVGIKWQYCKF